MRYTDIVSEAFDSRPLEWEWIEKKEISWIAEFQTENKVYRVFVECPGSDGMFEINFTARDHDDDNDTLEATGSGNAMIVYSTVINIILNFFKNNKNRIAGFIISGDPTERSRHAVNGRLANKLATILGFNIENDGESEIIISR